MADYASAGPEPNLAEMIADPVVQAVMLRDGVTEASLRACLWPQLARNSEAHRGSDGAHAITGEERREERSRATVEHLDDVL